MATQTVSLTNGPASAAPGASVQYQVAYTADATTPGLGLRLHFDSQDLSFQGWGDVYSEDKVQVQVQADEKNPDDDPATDKLLLASWADLEGAWPGTDSHEATLFAPTFTVQEGAEDTTFRFTGDPAGGASFQGEPVTLSVGGGDQPSDDQAPTVDAGQSLTLKENAAAGAVLGSVSANDNDGGTGVASYAITGGEAADWVAIDDQGQLTLTEGGAGSALNDFESGANEFAVEVTATDGADNTSDAQTVTLTTQNVDDQAPTVASGQSVSFQENAGDTTLGTVSASDNDGGTGVASYAIAGGPAADWVALDDQGNLTLTEAGKTSALNDYESGKNEFSVQVTATDQKGNTSEAQGVTLTTSNVDDQAPNVAADQSLSLEENAQAGDVIGSVSASDNEGGTGVAGFNVLSGDAAEFVKVDGNGELTLTEAGVASALNDYESEPNQFRVFLDATDEAGNRSAERPVTLNTTNVDDQKPTVAEGQSFTFEENRSQGTALGSVQASDDVSVASYAVVGGEAKDWVQITDQGQLSLAQAGVDSALNDYEAGNNQFTVDVQVTDQAGKTSAAPVTLNTANIDEAPVASDDSGGALDGQSVTLDVLANDSDPEGTELSLDSVSEPNKGSAAIKNGRIEYTPNEGTKVDSFTYTVADANGNTATASVTVGDTQPPSVAAEQTIAFDENAGNSALGTVQASDNEGGSGVASYAITGGEAADWVAIDDQGQLTLTEGGAGSALNDFESGANEFAVEVTATDGADNTSDAQTVTLTTQNVDDQAPSVASGQSVSFQENAGGSALGSVSASDNQGGSGVAGYAVAGGEAQDWVAIDNQGNLTLTEAGKTSALNDYESDKNEFSVQVTATDQKGNTSDAQTVTLTTTNVDDAVSLLDEGGSQTVTPQDGSKELFGTATGNETVTVESGAEAHLHASFNQGGDTLNLQEDFSAFDGSSLGQDSDGDQAFIGRSGATVYMQSDNDTLVSLPAGKPGMDVVFDSDGEANTKSLQINEAGDAIELGEDTVPLLGDAWTPADLPDGTPA